MQTKKTWLWIVLGVVAGIAVLFYLFYTKKRVNWDEHYKTSSKDPYGLYLIKELIADRYKDDMKDINKSLDEILPLDDTVKKGTIIYIGNTLNLTDRDTKSFYTFIEKGNNAFVSINQLPHSMQYLLYAGGTFTFDSATSTLIYPQSIPFMPVEKSDIEKVVDSLATYPEGGDSLPVIPYEQVEAYDETDDYDEDDAALENNTLTDTVQAATDTVSYEIPELSGVAPVHVQQAKIKTTLKPPLPDTHTTFTFETVKTSFFSIEMPYKWSLFAAQANLHYTCSKLTSVNDSMCNFISIPYGKGKLYIHTSPVLFSNFHLKEKQGFAYAKNILSVLSEGPVYWNEISASQGSANNEGMHTPKVYLKYILSFDSLRWAWYLLLATTFIYIVFTSKRKQRIIPVVEPIVNTSLEYVHTTGRLYAQIGNHRKLVQLNMRLFLSGIQQKYAVHINLSDPVSAGWLANKSGIPVEQYAELHNTYKKLTVPGHDIKTTELHTFYQQMQFIYKKIQN
ncbi:DUF4350 domain-containing protein [Cytophaga hutchinsonii]|uniref:DUF4350 domain-containing protein n=1 Tax=Cytophaga hutchinsonii (strain ATCC 33406 / DSM 1761 / CIP 103989 / NBRC 15051 / NCIMB 9469 / D465) TaxID=269798 RepID=A0A6N4SSU5_CYTH3|nr:DUF4350 domain-containing protein [Cytophaga hutchinsonii]ABG59398.1 conserved hypothetical protein [Cytophaga hutchinsonii ATCC 33406]SFX92978.1 hypothetical protein SAMN04487930_11388 [Cytophaga hutchinsonii ATCC 33406]